MDRAPPDLVTETDEPLAGAACAAPALVPSAVKPDRVRDADEDLSLRKQRLIDAARAVDPLRPLRRHPFVTVVAAAAIGVVAASPAAARTVIRTSSSSRIASKLLRLAAAQLAGRWQRYQHLKMEAAAAAATAASAASAAMAAARAGDVAALADGQIPPASVTVEPPPK
jgi:hypothetical protein